MPEPLSVPMPEPEPLSIPEPEELLPDPEPPWLRIRSIQRWVRFSVSVSQPGMGVVELPEVEEPEELLPDPMEPESLPMPPPLVPLLSVELP